MIRHAVLGRAIGAAAFILSLGVGSANAASITYTLSGGGGLGSPGNQLSFNSGGVTVYSTAWYSTGGNFMKAALGQWSSGLGVCNSGEESGDDTPFNDCDSPLHTVDNSSQFDYVLFLFDKAVDLTSVEIVAYDDTDVSYWAGNVAGAASQANLLGSTNFAGLGALGFGATQNNDGGSSSRTVTLNSPLNSYNALLFGAQYYTSCGDCDDRFKIKNLKIDYTPDQFDVPEPATMALFGLGLIGAARARRRRQSN